MAVDLQISRRSSGSDPLVPEPLRREILQGLPAASAVFGLVPETQRITMSALTERTAVLSVLPEAFFVSGDTGLKQTTRQQWINKSLVAEEIAVIIPIPENYLADAQTPIWEQVRPRLIEAAGALVDEVVIFNMSGSKPSTWGPDIYHTAIARGNYVHEGFGPDLGVSIARGGELLAADGYDLNGFVSKPGLGWKLVQMRSSDGLPIYQPDLQNGGVGNLYGLPLRQLKNGAWNSTESTLIGGDWSQAIIGIRQDISFRIFTEGVITDGAGVVKLNLMQQDAVALRMTMRCAWQVANPANRMNQDTATGNATAPTESTTRWPWFVLRPVGYSYS
jgi:hypothetical protein